MAVTGITPDGTDAASGTPSISLHHFIDIYPAPALFVAAGGEASYTNSRGALMAAALAERLDTLVTLVEVARSSGQPGVQEICISDRAENSSVIDVTALPVEGGVLLLGRDTTLERNLIGALASSRQLLKDIVECVPDFSWEADAGGVLTFVAPRKAFGYSAAELVGRNASELIDTEWSQGRPNPFQSDRRSDGVEIWLVSKDGTRVCTRTTSLPVRDGEGRRVATRGVCHDVTVARAREAALTQALDRERLRGAIVEAMRSRGGPERAVRVAAEATMAALAARAVIVVRNTMEGTLTVACQIGAAPQEIQSFLMKEASRIERLDHPAEVETATVGRQALLISPVRENGKTVGMIVLLRPESRPWSPDHGSLLATVADQLGLALALIARVEQLEHLSRIDMLTGLLNRRSFSDEMPRKLRHADRYRRPGCLMMLDLDGFKALNDRMGHQTGDRFLAELGPRLARQSRGNDLVVRFGGDEFALWLDDCTEAGGIGKGKAILGVVVELRHEMGLDGIPVGASAGLALYEPGSGETEAALVARADAALYSAKADGRNRIVASHPPAGPQ